MKVLGDLDEADWEISKLTDKPEDPWHDTRYLYLIDPLTGMDFTFITDTTGGRRAVSDLKRQIRNIRGANPNAVPLVELGSTMMPTRWGPKPRPEFRVIEWRGLKVAESIKQIADQETHDFSDDDADRRDRPMSKRVQRLDKRAGPPKPDKVDDGVPFDDDIDDLLK